jgi:hypothetical protein
MADSTDNGYVMGLEASRLAVPRSLLLSLAVSCCPSQSLAVPRSLSLSLAVSCCPSQSLAVPRSLQAPVPRSLQAPVQPFDGNAQLPNLDGNAQLPNRSHQLVADDACSTRAFSPLSRS